MPQVVIAGGGPAGLAAAIALAERNIAVTVVDPTGGVVQTRAEMLAQGAGAIMQRLGLGQALRDALHIKAVESVWGRAHLQSHGAIPGLGLHGWGVDRRTLSLSMRTRATALGAKIVKGRVGHTRKMGAGWHVDISENGTAHTVKSSYLIDATGRPSHIARRNGATSLHGPNLVALLWHIPSEAEPIMVAEAAKDGWWYAVPSRTGSTIGFVTSAANAKQMLKSPGSTLDRAVRALTRIPIPNNASPSATMDCRSAVLDRACEMGWVATGDAMAAFDPISSQGLFNALSGGFFAGNAVADAIAGNTDAPMVYAALAARTAERTHASTRLQYAALPFDTPFWRDRAASHDMRPHAEKTHQTQAHCQ
ncbi:tryptophan 7-halogenase [Tateyamaria omphalii]|uniref:tryptophan 7-halogenase n=1 Tax=Tateyamaria omphalii TaxID=299262 RepID=UPI001C992575|nr:tryptophan 7-halogenase [Tateyamaria omphalii]MBY5934038.1 tryptophan 7-halogenase [Tateyamaria omphalii]